jgi:hypothetical protein
MDPAPPIRVNRAPVLTLWATVVAERLGYPPDIALTLGRFVAGSSARAKARRLGISDEKQDAEERHARAAELKPHQQTVRLLGREIPVMSADDGTLRAEDDGKPASTKRVQTYVARAFGDRLADARAAMEGLDGEWYRLAAGSGTGRQIRLYRTETARLPPVWAESGRTEALRLQRYHYRWQAGSGGMIQVLLKSFLRNSTMATSSRRGNSVAVPKRASRSS